MTKNGVSNLRYIWFLETEIIYRLVNQFDNNISAILREPTCSVRCPQVSETVRHSKPKTAMHNLQCTNTISYDPISCYLVHWMLVYQIDSSLRGVLKIICFHHFANSCYGHNLLVNYFMTLILVKMLGNSK
jgi:hypothetical protein